MTNCLRYLGYWSCWERNSNIVSRYLVRFSSVVEFLSYYNAILVGELRLNK